MNDMEHRTRSGLRLVLAVLLAVTLAYQMLTIWYPIHGALQFYYAHIGLILALTALQLINEAVTEKGWYCRRVFLLVPALVLAVTCSTYLHLMVPSIEMYQPFITRIDFWAGAGLIAAVLVLTWFVWGAILASFVGLAILYFVFGHLLPAPLALHRPYEADIIMSYLAGMGGARGLLWGIPLSAETIFLIMVIGGLFRGTYVLEMFNEIGRILVRFLRGGVCYSSIVASSLIGMVTGQAVANIAISGSMTIPSMKQQGLSSEQAGAVEVVASLGSQLIPPIMGLGAFLMAVTLGVSYIEVVKAAVVPAILFVGVVLIGVFFMIRSLPVTRSEADDQPVDVRRIFWTLPSFAISFGTLVLLLYWRYSPGYAAFWAILLLTSLSMLRPRMYRPSLRGIAESLGDGVMLAAKLALILAAIGVVVQVLVTTGAGFDIGRLAMAIAGDNVGIALLLGMGIALIVGMGLPTPAAYALLAIIMIPSLIEIGVEPLGAHFFGFYFAIFSAVSPPVAVGVMTASRISGGSFYRSLLETGKMSLVGLLIPFSFVAFPSLLAFPSVSMETVVVSLAMLIITAMWASAVYGIFIQRLSKAERVLMLCGPVIYLWALLHGNAWLTLLALTPLLLVSIINGRVWERSIGAQASTDGR